MEPPAEDGAGRTDARAGSRSPRRSRKIVAPPIIKPDEGEHFTQLAGSLPFIVWTSTPGGAVDYFNDAFVLYTGLDPDALLTDGWRLTVHPDDLEAVGQQWGAAVASGDPYEIDFRIRRADGEYRWHRVSAHAVLDHDGSTLRWWGSAVDIDELRVLEAKTARLAADREAILESIADGVFTLDHEWRFTYLNRNAEHLLQRIREDIVGAVFWDEFPETVKANLEDMLKRVAETGNPERMDDYAGPLKTWFDVSATQTPDGLTVYLRDITHVKSLAEQLAIAHRMDAIGQLTGGIAHDFNNLLTVIVGGTESLAEEPDLTPAGQDMIGLVSQAAARGAELTRRLLAFARRQPLAPQAIDVGRHISDIIPLLRRTLGEGINIVVEVAPALPAAHVDPGQFESALLNLGINARDAMPDGGTLTLGTSVIHFEEAYPTLYSEILAGTYVVVSVSDSGTGIPAEYLGRIFDPFFTTKPVGEGSGLGLAMVWGFVRQSGGHVTVYSEPGRGTVIRLYLPVAPEGAPSSTLAPDAEAAVTAGTGHILLVEDDDLVRKFAAGQLVAHGYRVTTASSGPEALRLLDEMGHLDLLFTDVIMPGGMTGRQLATEVVTRRPGTPILYASGYTENVNLRSGLPDSDVVLLTKPYSSAQLLETIQRLLTSPNPETSLW